MSTSTVTPIKPDESATAPPDPDGKALFDRSRYDDPALRIAKVDDHQIDKIRVEFSGSVMLDRKNPDDVKLFNSLALGKPCEMRVGGTVAKKATGYTTGKEGDLDAVVGASTIKVDTVYVLAPEDLS